MTETSRVSYATPMPPTVDAPGFCQRLRASDPQAFEDLFCDTYPALIRFATRLTRSHETAEDVVMGIFQKVWDRRTVWQPANPRGYLYGAVRNDVATNARNLNTQQALLASVVDGTPGMATAAFKVLRATLAGFR